MLFKENLRINFVFAKKLTISQPLPTRNISMASAGVFGLQMLQLGQHVESEGDILSELSSFNHLGSFAPPVVILIQTKIA